ncbi:hypothetical protein MCOR27_001527 [Pyricularia oryzae]|uniref:DUF202 domain-containing protein n=5 Tax=Pyricularia TaxID=48558 RepID=A0ABQ8NJ50_PYRGI|nr:uncharacterized protein MGG_01246 [Pyricularia oryzae 70-15]ELQ42443.1 hypothetical protein OOU_Y34scaffold00207g8 [Pyricularia oryzae Y34]KAH8836948.1 hypothetical protein MCOR01_010594 [Pyricularia oryzae]KAI6296577.1 hypothetical protein MCOR33_006848 [Pyricularia grisea]EHA54346.1 hypothetical protein MGG_01246 [Pyricularia oryzae 70-15]KAH9438396.1 hypothetical protein MCOR02_002030 [Pyricularia oryzae]
MASPLTRTLARLRSPTYPNTGSVARDHLASERTFLAWIRTGLGFVALGIAIERFSQLDLSELLHPQSSPTTTATATATAASSSQNQRAQSQQDRDQTRALVGPLLGLGSGSIVYGAARYFSNLVMLERGLFRPAYYGVAVLAAGVAGLSGGLYGNVVRIGRRNREEAE